MSTKVSVLLPEKEKEELKEALRGELVVNRILSNYPENGRDAIRSELLEELKADTIQKPTSKSTEDEINNIVNQIMH